MPSVQEKLTDAVWATIRSRQDDRDRNSLGRPLLPRTQAAVAIRLAQFSDFEDVARLGQRLGQGSDSPENWKRLWLHNPAVQSGKAGSRIGWGLESGGAVVG